MTDIPFRSAADIIRDARVETVATPVKTDLVSEIIDRLDALEQRLIALEKSVYGASHHS